MEWYYVWWPWLTTKCVVRVCQLQMSFLFLYWARLAWKLCLWYGWSRHTTYYSQPKVLSYWPGACLVLVSTWLTGIKFSPPTLPNQHILSLVLAFHRVPVLDLLNSLPIQRILPVFSHRTISSITCSQMTLLNLWYSRPRLLSPGMHQRSH